MLGIVYSFAGEDVLLGIHSEDASIHVLFNNCPPYLNVQLVSGDACRGGDLYKVSGESKDPVFHLVCLLRLEVFKCK